MQVVMNHPSERRGVLALRRALADIEAPGWAVLYGDRRETLKAAIDLRHEGKRLVHVGAGETPRETKSHPDHDCRDAISMLCDVFFVANDHAVRNLRNLGCGLMYGVWKTGCPSLDEIVALSKTPAPKRDGSVFEWFPEYGRGWTGNCNTPDPEPWKPAWLPETKPRLSEAEFLQRLRTCSLFRTNSSAGLREAPILGTPVEMVGDRQAGRAPAGTYHHPEGRACEEIRRIVMEVCT